MKEIKKTEIIRNVKKMLKEGREFCEGGYNRYFRPMINTHTGEIWTDLFLNDTSYKVYQSEDVKMLVTITKANWYDENQEKEEETGYIKDAIEKLENAGWKIIE